ncbi:MAG: hypothetical protein ABT940_04825 [Alphaproteobacteria bacterium]
MNAPDIDSVIADVMSALLLKTVQPGENIIRKNEARWDSLMHMEIIYSIEAAYEIEFVLDDIVAINDLAGLKSIIEMYLAKK